ALDNNLRIGGTRYNDRTNDFASELRYRNAIVTGNAPGGASFRGNVGYTAAEDFRAPTASNDFFAFTRDSLLSGLGGRGVRGADAIQLQRQFTTGGVLDQQTGLPLIAERPAAGATYQSRQVGAGQPISSIDPFSLRPGALRSTSTFAASDALSPRLLATLDGEDGGSRYAVASPLRGVVVQGIPDYPSSQIIPEVKLPEMQGLEGLDRDAEEDEGPSRPSATGLLSNSRVNAEASTKVERGAASQKVETQKYDYTRVLDEMRAAFEASGEEEDEGVRAPGDADAPDEPRLPFERTVEPPADGEKKPAAEGAQGQEAGEGAGTKPAGVGLGSSFEQRLNDLRERMRESITESRGKEEDDDRRTPAIAEAAREVLGLVEPRVQELAPPAAAERDLFAESMKEAQQALREGRWFDAEERFTSSLRLSPGNPLAAVGRVHSQLGAGLFRSAASNLRQLFLANPEMIGVRYQADLLPREQRLEDVRKMLRENQRIGGEVGLESSLLLAYLARQSGDQEGVRSALSAYDAISADMKQPLSSLMIVVRSVWLEEDGD
ncbi:MAG: hypothetical protein VYC34_00995, partial [Planctomycetota bacterium]|nr:hypothetical protein [Planctomycetota bacterium]